MADFTFIPGESFNGAIARWADEIGGVERMIEITGDAGVRHGHRQRTALAGGEGAIRSMAANMRVDANELLARATPNEIGHFDDRRYRITFAGMVLPTHLIEKQARRFSPAALAESAHHRALWDVRLIPACVQTGEILLDRCGGPDCGPVGWSATLGIDRCEHCMADLKRAVTTSIPESTKLALAEVAGLFSHDPSIREATVGALPPAVAALGGAAIIDLLIRVAIVADCDLPTSPAALLLAPPLAVCEAVAQAWIAVKGWPEGMSALASARIRSRTKRHDDGNRGRTVRFLRPKWQASASKQVQDLIAAWRGSISVDLESGVAVRERTVPPLTVAQATGIDYKAITRQRRAGLFNIEFVLDLQRPEIRFDAVELDTITAALRERATVSETRKRLGMSSHGIEQLLGMGLLELLQHPFLEAYYGTTQLTRRSLHALEEAVAATASHIARNSTEGLKLRSAMKGVGGRVKPWGPALAMLISGELPFALLDADRPLSERVLVDTSAVPLLRSLYLPDRLAAELTPYMSKADAGELLNLWPNRATEFLAGFGTHAGTHEKKVPLEAAEVLGRLHITPAELASRRGVRWPRAQADAITAGVPLLGPGGFCRKRAEAVFFPN